MTLSVYDDIRSALETHLNSTPSLPTVAWENVKFEPITGVQCLRVRLINTAREPAVRGLNPQYRYQGVFQILVCSPEGVGPSANQTLVNTLVDRFQTGDDMTSNGVAVTVKNTEAMGAYNNSPWYVTPVNIHWFAYA